MTYAALATVAAGAATGGGFARIAATAATSLILFCASRGVSAAEYLQLLEQEFWQADPDAALSDGQGLAYNEQNGVLYAVGGKR